MNKQEAIRRMKRERFHVPYGPGIFVHAVFADKAIELINQIHEPQKVVVPKFVGEWLEWCKENSLTLSEALSAKENKSDDLQTAVNEWLTSNREDLFAQAWLDGYEIEQEKLYTVEIPNPNATYNDVYILGRTLSGDISIWRINRDSDIKNYDSDFHLTESEIKQDFEWAWDAGFAKEVE